jgi:hypothetical protein
MKRSMLKLWLVFFVVRIFSFLDKHLRTYLVPGLVPMGLG